MKYKLVYTRRADRDTKELNPDIKIRVGRMLLRFAEEPFRFAEKLTNSDLGNYRFRIGNYRVIFDIHEDEIVILRIGHRKEIYRKR